jgi:uncharacterized protein YjiS (DUF1127 family)
MQKLLRLGGYPASRVWGFGEAAELRSCVADMLRQLGAAISRWAIRHGTRRALAELERHQLLDIGKTVEDARREAAKPFWRA